MRKEEIAMKKIDGGVTAPKGFLAAGCAAGIIGSENKARDRDEEKKQFNR